MIDFPFDWSAEFNTNMETIDVHHRQFFRIGRDIEQLLQMKCIGVSDKQLLDIVLALREYVSYHFYEEETMMMDYAYPESGGHKEYHKMVSKRVAEINIPALKANPMAELKQIKDLLLDVVFNHILTEDKKMTQYVMTVQKRMREEVEAISKIDEYEEKYGLKICELDVTKVYLYKNQSSMGRCILIYKGKAKEISRLTVLERDMLFSDVTIVAKAIQKTFSPEAFNYGSYSDIEEQLHFHIVPKYKEQGDWGEQFSTDITKGNLSLEEYEKIVQELKRVLKV